jgi:hypothetical protein
MPDSEIVPTKEDQNSLNSQRTGNTGNEAVGPQTLLGPHAGGGGQAGGAVHLYAAGKGNRPLQRVGGQGGGPTIFLG